MHNPSVPRFCRPEPFGKLRVNSAKDIFFHRNGGEIKVLHFAAKTPLVQDDNGGQLWVGYAPVIVATSDDNLEMRDKAFKLGATDFVVKPIVPSDFLPRVRRFVG